MPTAKKTAGPKKTAKKSFTSKAEEVFQVKGDELLTKVKKIIKEGNVRKLIIKDKNGTILIEFTLTIGVVLTVLAPVLAAIGAIAALIGECSITVVREK